MALWQDVRGWLLSYIHEHGLAEGATLPSDREISESCGCSLQPVLRAMRNLVDEGVLSRQAGAATQIRSLPSAMRFHSFSFRTNVRQQGMECTTHVIEQCRRLPNPGELNAVERRAQSCLGLPSAEPFYAVARIRVLDGTPRVIERAYLNPAHFPKTLLTGHDFSTESLIDVYRTYGFDPVLRDTAIQARLAGEEEQELLGIGPTPVLVGEQEMRARNADTAAPVIIEFLYAVYRDWTFRTVDCRPAPASADTPDPS